MSASRACAAVTSAARAAAINVPDDQPTIQPAISGSAFQGNVAAAGGVLSAAAGPCLQPEGGGYPLREVS